MKTKNLIMAIAMVFAIISTSTAQTVWNGTANTDWYNTSQTEFTITTAEQLAGLAKLVNNRTDDFIGKTIKLGANIMLNDTTNWQNWENNPPKNKWTPIGIYPFLGNFDGNGKIISGVYVANDDGISGLFGSLGSQFNMSVKAKITNLGVVASYIWGNGSIGGLVGRNELGTITNSYARANVKGSVIYGAVQIGVLVGFNYSGVITNCYAIGSATALSYGEVGGLLGMHSYDGVVENCYAVGTVTGGTNGGLIGSGGYNKNVINSYYDSDVSGKKNDDMGIPKTTAQMKSDVFGALNLWAYVNNSDNPQYLEWVMKDGGYPVFGTGYLQNFDSKRIFGNGMRDISNVSISGNLSNLTYSGSEIKPSVTVKDNCAGYEFPLTEGVDYIISYEKNTNAGTANIKIFGLNGYSSNTTKEFTINKRNVAVNWDNLLFTYDGTVKTPTAVSSDQLFPVSAVIGGQTNFGTYNASVSLLTTNDNIILQNATKEFTINKRNISINWGNLSFTYDGTAKMPTAVSNDNNYPIKINESAKTESGVYSFSVSLQTPNDNIILQNTTKQFTINKRNVSVNWSGDLTSEYDGSPKTVTAISADPLYPVSAVSGGTQTNAGIYTASVNLQTPNDNIILQNVTKEFIIERTQGKGSVSLTGWRSASKPNDPVAFSETNGSDGVTFTYRSVDNSYAQSPSKPANPGIYIVKAIFPQTQNYKEATAECEFTISTRDAESLEVVWTEKTEFVYNKMVQVPMPSIKGRPEIELIVLNGQAVAGEYKGALSALAVMKNEWEKQFYYLQDNTIEYKIVKKPLDIVMKDESGNKKDEIVAELDVTSEADLLTYIESILAYDGFATDIIKNETDNESVLKGKPSLIIENKDSRSLRSMGDGEYLVKIITDNVSADNYSISQRTINVSINSRIITLAIEPRGETSIKKTQKSEGYGIRFMKNIVSDKAEISIILPNNERIVETKIVIYDMTGNAVYSGNNLIWNLTNNAGRFVANGSYLVFAETKGISGKAYQHYAKLGVKR